MNEELDAKVAEVAELDQLLKQATEQMDKLMSACCRRFFVLSCACAEISTRARLLFSCPWRMN